MNVWGVGDGGKEKALKEELQKLFADSPNGTTVHLTGTQGSADPLVFKITDANENETFWHQIYTSKTGSSVGEIIAEIRKAVGK